MAILSIIRANYILFARYTSRDRVVEPRGASGSTQKEQEMQHQIVHLYVLDTLADWEPGYAIAGLNNAPSGRFRVMTVGVSKAPVRTSGGVAILPDMTLEELAPSQSAMLI